MKRKQRMLMVYLFWSAKNKRSEFGRICKKKPLVLFAYITVVFGKPISLAGSVSKNIFITYSK